MKKKRKNSKQFNKKFKNRFFTIRSGLVIGMTVVIILFLAVGGLYQKKEADRYKEAILELNSEIKDLNEANRQLEQEKEETGSKEFKERVAREKLGLIGKDEYALKEAEGQDLSDGKEQKRSGGSK